MRYYKTYFHHRDIDKSQFIQILKGVRNSILTRNDECKKGDIIVLFENDDGERTGREYRDTITYLYKGKKENSIHIKFKLKKQK